MASIYKEIRVDVPPQEVWAAFRDVGAVHTRLANGFVQKTMLENDSRVVTFANGVTVRERIVDVNDRLRRVAYSVVDWETTHHNASFQVFPDGPTGSRIVWITDLLPDGMSDLVEGMMEQGCAAIAHTLESTRATAH
jgi:carbon monoxide dehydrogenase subunit G